jgi:hypothetical protein
MRLGQGSGVFAPIVITEILSGEPNLTSISFWVIPGLKSNTFLEVNSGCRGEIVTQPITIDKTKDKQIR